MITLALFVLALATPQFASASPAKFPMSFTKDGMTITITGASWVNAPRYGKGLLVHFTASGDATVPFKIDDTNVRFAFFRPNGDNIGYMPFEGDGIYHSEVSPNWGTVHIGFEASDPTATSEKTDGYAEQSLEWDNVPVPTTRDTPVTVNVTKNTGHGSAVTLDKIEIRSPSPQTGGQTKTTLVFHAMPSTTIPDLKFSFQPGPTVSRGDGGDTIVDNRHMYWPQPVDMLTGAAGSSSYDLPFAPDELNLKSLNISVPVYESAKSLRDPTTYRIVRVDLPLDGLPGGDAATTSAASLGHASAGGMDATLESIAPTFGRQWRALFWLTVPNGLPTYQLRRCDIVTDTGENLVGDRNFAMYEPDRAHWKSNGAAPAIDEHSAGFEFTLPNGFPPGAKSLTVTTTAGAFTLHSHSFVFKNLPSPAEGSRVTLNTSATEAIDAANPTATPAKMTITSINCEATNSDNGPSHAKDRLTISYHLDNVAYTASIRTVRFKTMTDDHGRQVDVRFVSNQSEADNRIVHISRGPQLSNATSFVYADAPARDVKTFDVSIELTDGVTDAPPVKFVFPNIPIPAGATITPPPLSKP